MRQRARVALGVAGGVVVAVGLIVITASAAGVNLAGSPQSAARPLPTISPVPSPSSGPTQTNPAARFESSAIVAAEAQVLGISVKQLSVVRRQGMTIHQLADVRGITEADFEARVAASLKPILDQGVGQGQLTDQQEQMVLNRLSRGIPNWDQIARPGAAGSPNPSSS